VFAQVSFESSLQACPIRFACRGQRCVVTDQRNRVTTDPGLGPVELDHPSTLRSIAAADPVEADNTGTPVYYEPKPLNATSDHKTLELETVKLAKDIDPRKLPTELTLRRPVLHVVPASDPSWVAPPSPYPANWPGAQQFESGWPPPHYDSEWPPSQYDSSWPPAETVLTTSQPPQAARRSLLPLLLVAALGGVLLLILGARAMRRTAALPITAQHTVPTPRGVAASPNKLQALPRASVPASAASAGVHSAAPHAASVPAPAGVSASSPNSNAPAAPLAQPNGAASARLADAPHHASVKPAIPVPANSPASSAPATAKPKRAIY